MSGIFIEIAVVIACGGAVIGAIWVKYLHDIAIINARHEGWKKGFEEAKGIYHLGTRGQS